MDMFTSYGDITKKITDFLMILACVSPFNNVTICHVGINNKYV